MGVVAMDEFKKKINQVSINYFGNDNQNTKTESWLNIGLNNMVCIIRYEKSFQIS